MHKLLSICLLFICFSLGSQELKPALPDAVKSILANYPDKSLNEENISYSLIELGTNNEVAFFGSERQIIPASLSKILTSYYALKVLGENFRFKTTLHSTGKIANGILTGDLYLTGDGDPILANSDLMGFVLALRERGIKKVNGQLYFDEGKYPKIKMISEIGLGDQTYNPGVSALSLKFNRFTIWRGGHRYKSIKSTFTPIPTIPYLQVEKISENFTPGLRFQNVESENELWKISNFLKYDIIEEVPIRKPAKYVSETFRMMAQNMGIEINESKPLPTVEKKIVKELVHEHYSKELHSIAKATMEYSNNLLAELLLLAADYKYYKSKSLDQASNKMMNWYRENYKDVNFSKTQFKNGSGLDTENKINAKTLSQFIAYYAPKKIQNKFFLSFLSISGQSGWLTKRMHDPEMSFKVFAKTGSLDYINNLAGVLFTASKKSYAFTISIYDFEKRKVLDGDNTQKLNVLREQAKPWNRDVRPLLDDVLRYFYGSL